jgi:hypothetical protein
MKTQAEIWANLDAQQRELENQIRLEEHHIVFYVRGEYAIYLATCANHQQLAAWVLHLCAKNWITPLMLRRFMLLVAEYHQLPLYDVG